MAKIVCEIEINGEQVVKAVTTTPGTAKFMLRTVPGPGKPFWCWNSIPAGQLIGADFTGAPLASADAEVNQTAIDAITATPQDTLIYAAP